jgi:ribosomal protein S18 acetylase RimI-like enzyme
MRGADGFISPFFQRRLIMLELATIRDKDAVNTLARQVHEIHVAWRPDIFRMPEGDIYSEERFLEAVRARELYVAKLNGIVVGYVLTGMKEKNLPSQVRRKVFLIEELCVENSFRGHGIGTRIMEEVHALARAFGCTDLQLNVYPQNDDAVGFYQKCGFMIQNINMQRKV